VHAPNENKNVDKNDGFFEELDHVFDQFPRYHIKILLGDFNEEIDDRIYFQTNDRE
jgi:hypothetical protein